MFVSTGEGGLLMDTIARLKELVAERDISFYKLAKLCGIPYSTLKNTANRNGQLSLDSIERICETLEIPMFEFFMTDDDWDSIDAYCLRRLQKHDRGNEKEAG